ncbi:DMT family transporter [Amphibiibacter pelophylacis]|uniref:DMT family transporter n=1 Tax=Amphibiibacter pelophylacis TaxID=1799477 RepID=A0ACC6P0M1_9BURK
MRRLWPGSGWPAPLLMLISTLSFATMALCVKWASTRYDYGVAEVITARGLVGVIILGAQALWRGQSLRTPVPVMHAWRAIFGVSSLALWFYAISQLPLATAVTMNYMSSIWLAIFLAAGGLISGARVDARLIAVVFVGFSGVVLVLRPTMPDGALWAVLSGLCSGMIAAMAYLQVSALGRIGEPTWRTVFYFSGLTTLSGLAACLLAPLWQGAAQVRPLESLLHSTPGGVLALIGAGVFATAGQMLLTVAYTRGQPMVNASLQYTGIVFSLIYGVVLFGDAVTPGALIGLALIVAAGITATRLRSQHKAA